MQDAALAVMIYIVSASMFGIAPDPLADLILLFILATLLA